MTWIGKLILTGIVVALAALVLAASSGDRGAADQRYWRGGQEDLVRRFLLRPDGSFRRGTKPFVVLSLAAVLAALWTAL